MNWREVNEADLIECLNIEPQTWGDGIVGRERALTVWQQWIRTRSFNSAVIETVAHSVNQKIAFGASIFVTTEFVTRELENPRAGLNDRIIASVVSGKSVVLPETCLSGSSARHPLDLVILGGNYLYQAMDPEQTIQAEMALPVSFAEAHVGYCLNRILLETRHRSGNIKRMSPPASGAPSRNSRTAITHSPYSPQRRPSLPPVPLPQRSSNIRSQSSISATRKNICSRKQ